MTTTPGPGGPSASGAPAATIHQSPWRRYVLPRLLDVTMDTEEARLTRQRVCAPLSGEVLEIGFGTGLNLPALPAPVTRVLAVDPMHRAVQRASGRIAGGHAEVRFVGPDAQHLPLEDASIDTALCTWSLCSIEDPVAAVAEVARVLRPGGALHFVEHGRSPDEGVRRWQRRLTPPWSRVAGGCHLDRDVTTILERGGLEVAALDAYDASGPRVASWTFEGRATRPS